MRKKRWSKKIVFDDQTAEIKSKMISKNDKFFTLLRFYKSHYIHLIRWLINISSC